MNKLTLLCPWSCSETNLIDWYEQDVLAHTPTAIKALLPHTAAGRAANWHARGADLGYLDRFIARADYLRYRGFQAELVAIALEGLPGIGQAYAKILSECMFGAICNGRRPDQYLQDHMAELAARSKIVTPAGVGYWREMPQTALTQLRTWWIEEVERELVVHE